MKWYDVLGIVVCVSFLITAAISIRDELTSPQPVIPMDWAQGFSSYIGDMAEDVADYEPIKGIKEFVSKPLRPRKPPRAKPVSGLPVVTPAAGQAK